MRKLTTLVAAVATAAGLGLAAAPVSAGTENAAAAPYCGLVWGSLTKSGGALSADPITDIRAGRHDCYDRLVVDIDGGENGFTVSYVDTVYAEGTGDPIPLRGGAFLAISVLNPAYDEGGATYDPANPAELVNVTGWQTFRQAAWGGSFEGYTTIGLGVRARLPFRVFSLAGPGTDSRVVIDVAHKW